MALVMALNLDIIRPYWQSNGFCSTCSIYFATREDYLDHLPCPNS